jgi:DNA-binding NtrC family response regulator
MTRQLVALPANTARERRQFPEALRHLKNYDFPGNVRELANIIERAVIVARGPSVAAGDLPEGLRAATARNARQQSRPPLREVEAEYIREILTAAKGNKTEAARILGISRKNLYERLAGRRRSKRRGSEVEIRVRKKAVPTPITTSVFVCIFASFGRVRRKTSD